MPTKAYRAVVFALYQLSLALGILALPVAVAANRVGLGLPLHRLVLRLEGAYESAGPN